MRALSSVLVAVAMTGAVDSPARGDTTSVSDTSLKVTSRQQAVPIALAYTGFDSTTVGEVRFKKFRLAGRPSKDSLGHSITKEAYLWVVTFCDVNIIAPGVFRDFKVFIDPESGLLVELYSMPIGVIEPHGLVIPFANEDLVADITQFHALPPQPCPFSEALRNNFALKLKESHQIFAICETDPRVTFNPQLSAPVWTIWAETEFFTIAFPSPNDGKMATHWMQVNAVSFQPYSFGYGKRLPYIPLK